MSVATPGLIQEALQAVVNQVRDIVANATDLLGAPLPIDVLAAYNLQDFKNPVVTVALELGEMRFQGGMNLLRGNDDGTFTAGLFMPNTHIVLCIVALSPAQRFRIIDLLITGVLNSTYTMPDGTVLDSAFIRAMQQQGITIHSMIPELQPWQDTDSRQKGDVFRGTLTLVADVWLNWQPQSQVVDEVLLTVEPDFVDAATEPSLAIMFSTV